LKALGDYHRQTDEKGNVKDQNIQKREVVNSVSRSFRAQRVSTCGAGIQPQNRAAFDEDHDQYQDQGDD
jgi:hypothetical protein